MLYSIFKIILQYWDCIRQRHVFWPILILDCCTLIWHVYNDQIIWSIICTELPYTEKAFIGQAASLFLCLVKTLTPGKFTKKTIPFTKASWSVCSLGETLEISKVISRWEVFNHCWKLISLGYYTHHFCFVNAHIKYLCSNLMIRNTLIKKVGIVNTKCIDGCFDEFPDKSLLRNSPISSNCNDSLFSNSLHKKKFKIYF